GRIRRYAHVGTGNYNPDTARVYSDLGLFTAEEDLGADLNALFNELTGSSRPPQADFRRLLVAPTNMLLRFLDLIEREAEHARTDRSLTTELTDPTAWALVADGSDRRRSARPGDGASPQEQFLEATPASY